MTLQEKVKPSTEVTDNSNVDECLILLGKEKRSTLMIKNIPNKLL
jgi:hypothetical protein